MAGQISPLAGKPVTQAMLVNVPRLMTQYFSRVPDPSLASDHGLIALHPGKANRVAEARRHSDFCSSLNIPTLGQIQPPGKTEAGDMVWLDSTTLLIGQGYRTNPAGIAQMRAMLQPYGVAVLSAPLPHGAGPSACLHLMSLMSLLNEQSALVDLPWLAVETVDIMPTLAGLIGLGYDHSRVDGRCLDLIAGPESSCP